MGGKPRSGRRATLANDGWELESAEDRVAETSGTFEIPPRDHRERVPKGWFAKLLFQIREDSDERIPDVCCERMWVRTNTRTPQGYVGELANHPACRSQDNASLTLGTRVEFGPEHIIDLLAPQEA